MNYPLVATSLTRRQCEKIQFKAINASLSKCRYSRTTPRAIVFLSPWFGGLGWRHLFFKQGIQHAILIIKHLRTPGPFQSLLHISLQWYYQVIAGVSFSPFSAPQIPLTYLDSAWLDSTREFLAHCDAHLTIPIIPLPSLKRRNDECIMDGFLTLKLPRKTLSRLNFCQLWLKVTTLSDICSLPGDRIDRKAWLCTAPMPSSQADWPVQQRPHNKVWSLWRAKGLISKLLQYRKPIRQSLEAWETQATPRSVASPVPNSTVTKVGHLLLSQQPATIPTIPQRARLVPPILHQHSLGFRHGEI
jgi:hypothetical protein